MIEVRGVRFKWQKDSEPSDCMNRAVVTISDACHTITGTLEICTEVRDNRLMGGWKVLVGGKTERGHSANISTDLKSFVRTAMDVTARYFNEALEDRQEATRQILVKQAAQHQRADMVAMAIAELELE